MSNIAQKTKTNQKNKVEREPSKQITANKNSTPPMRKPAKSASTDNQNQNYNILTGNVGHPAIAKQIIESIVQEARYSATVIDGLVMIFEAFADKSESIKARDFADELQQFLFTKTTAFDDATDAYIKSIKAGKNYDTEHLHLIAN